MGEVQAPSCKLYVGNLPWDTTSDHLYEAFGKFGVVSDAFIPVDRESGRSRGFGFVTLDSSDSANAAITEMNGQEFGGRQLRVNLAAPQDKSRSGRGGYGGGGGGYQQQGGYKQQGGYNQGYGGGGY